MSVKFLISVLCVSVAAGEQVVKRADSVSSATDFVHLPPVQLREPRILQGAPDLTALQQSHVLGNFHHRFHPSREGFQFATNPSQVVFPSQGHAVPPQQPQNQRSLQQPQHTSLLSSQDFGGVHQNFKPLNTPTKTQVTFGAAQEQSIKNSFPTNAPHTIKFSISSQNYNPNQGKHFETSQTPAIGQHHQHQHHHQQQQQSNLARGRVISGVQAHTSRPANAQQFNNVNYHQPTYQFNNSPKIQQTGFQNFNVQPKVTFGLTPTSADVSAQHSLNAGQQNLNFRPQQSNEISGEPIIGKPVGPAEPQPHFGHQTQSNIVRRPAPPLIQSSVELKQEDLIQQHRLGQQQLIQPGFSFPKNQGQQPYLQTTAQPLYQFSPTESQGKFSQSSGQVPGFEYRTTESVRSREREGSSRRQEDSTLPPSSTPALADTNGRRLAFEKSQNHLQFALNEKALSTNHRPNDVSSSTAKESVTSATVTPRKPKPIVKEITINLNDPKILGGASHSQVFIKENGDTEIREIKGKESKEQKRKKEKTQEDLINEQIHKLLQSHNLEIIGKDNEAQTNSQEAQLSKVSEQFKKYNYSVQLLNSGGLLSEIKEKQKVPTTLPPLPELPEHIKKQYEIKLIEKDELLKQFDLPSGHNLGNDTSKLFIANGQQLELVKFTKDGLMNKIPIGSKSAFKQVTTTAKPPKVLFEELTKEVIPPGANFELIRHKGDGQVEKVDGIDSGKKVTFVFLEEQPDGSVKIQGVKGNDNQEGDGNEVDSLIKKIKNGSIKLPPSQKLEGSKGLLNNEISRLSPTTSKSVLVKSGATGSTASGHEKKEWSEQGTTAGFSYNSPYSVNLGSQFPSSPSYVTTQAPPTTFSPTLNYVRTSSRKPADKSRTRGAFLPTLPNSESTFTPTFGARRVKPTSSTWSKTAEAGGKPQKSSVNHEGSDLSGGEILSHRSTEYRGQRFRVPQDVIAEESNINAVHPLNEVLKENGLNEMAKFLEQSGLDTILNETGPYTIFIPTDKAFRKLETQLGGPDKAEDKFRENPRLLSGLLLHHVVPGSFRVEDLQDEMTGVSLAGTQLRVNTYFSDQKRSKENSIVTVNGAKVSNDSKDIVVPQGLAHSIDRVLFPLPIGDILQTLKSDRERRFTKFLKSLEYSGLSDMLTGSKTYTVFAPTDKAFSVLTDAELEKLLTKREAAKTIVLRHIVPGTLYTAGMNYFQIKESMEEGQKIIIKKELGKIKANSAQIISANIPATNGVIHAVETLL